MLTKRGDCMDDRIKRLKTPEECEIFAKNAIERNHPELAIEARKQAVKLRSEQCGAESEIERECWGAIFAYEEVLAVKNNKRNKANRTRNMIPEYGGIVKTFDHIVKGNRETEGYKALKDLGLEDYTYESVVLRYQDSFSKEAVAQAKRRMSEWEG
jgi:hypothetical protein